MLSAAKHDSGGEHTAVRVTVFARRAASWRPANLTPLPPLPAAGRGNRFCEVK